MLQRWPQRNSIPTSIAFRPRGRSRRRGRDGV